MPERPLQFICEMCGGIHPTSEHKTVTETARVSEITRSQEVALTPEVAEKIMDKVSDIDTPGLAYSTIIRGAETPKRLKTIFDTGLLGSAPFAPGGKGEDKKFHPEKVKEGWAKVLRKRAYVVYYHGDSFQQFNTLEEAKDFAKHEKVGGIVKRELTGPRDLKVYFNIVGRAYETLDPHRTQIAQSSFANIENSVTVLFDLSDFREVPGREGTRSFPVDLGTFKPAMDKGAYRRDIKTGKINPALRLGFLLSPRVRPRRFRGLVISGPIKKGAEKLQSQASKIVDLMRKIYQNRPEMLLPIYDLDGNLLWPKQMNYEEVKKVADEKNKKSLPPAKKFPRRRP